MKLDQMVRLVKETQRADKALNTTYAGTCQTEHNAILLMIVDRLDNLNATMKLLIKPLPPRRDPNEPELGDF